MKKKLFNRSQGKPADRKDLGLLEELIARYFKKQLDREDDLSTADHSFESYKVYKRVMNTIDKQSHSIVQLKHRLQIAASVIGLAGLLTVGFYYFNDRGPQAQSAVALLEKKAAKGQTVAVTLPDSTKVWLNADSKLSYPAAFTDTSRAVVLTGEAYFEVTPRSHQPFIIQSGDIRTTVLGTWFNVKAYPGNNTAEVTVVSGKVAVTAGEKGKATEQTLYLTPDEQATYDKTGVHLEKQAGIDADAFIGWKTGKMIYREASIKQVIEEVERKYDVVITSSERLSHCTITADFDNEKLSKVLTVIARLVNGQVTFKNGQYYLTGNGCE